LSRFQYEQMPDGASCGGDVIRWRAEAAAWGRAMRAEVCCTAPAGEGRSRPRGAAVVQHRFETRVRMKSEELGALRGLVVDMDGVLWRGEQPIPGIDEMFEAIVRRGLRHVFVTNSPHRGPEELAEKAGRFGLPVRADQIITAGCVTVQYLQQHFARGARVHVICEPGFKERVAAAGFVLADESVAAVVVGMDFSLNYEMIKRGALLLQNGAAFIGIHGDACFPSAEGLLPAAGALIAMLAVSSGREPVLMGKPAAPIFEMALVRLDLSRDEVACVGDSLQADISGGRAMGMKTILVLSGVTARAEADASNLRPDWIFDSAKELGAALRLAKGKDDTGK